MPSTSASACRRSTGRSSGWSRAGSGTRRDTSDDTRSTAALATVVTTKLMATAVEITTSQSGSRLAAPTPATTTMSANSERLARREEEEGGRPPVRCLAADRCHEDDRDEVLHHQDPDRGAPVQRACGVLLLQHLHRDHRAGERQGNGHEDQVGPLRPGEQADAHGASGRQQCHRQHGAQEGVHHADTQHLASAEHPDVQLEADGEQQQQHAEVRHHVQGGCAVDTHGGQDEARPQEADHRRQPHHVGRQAADDGQGQHEHQVDRHATSHSRVGATLGRRPVRVVPARNRVVTGH